MIRVYNSKDKGQTWKELILMEGFFDKRTLERLWDGQTVDYLIGLFTLEPKEGTIIKGEENGE